MNYPQRPMQHELEAESEIFFRQHLPAGYVVNRPNADYGYDFIIDVAENGQMRGINFYVQLKSSERPSGDVENETVRLSTATYNFLKRNVNVVFIVKYVRTENEAYWILLRDIPRPDPDNETFTVHIPKRNRITTINWQETIERVRHIVERKIEAANDL